jgi:hypothetical protein
MITGLYCFTYDVDGHCQHILIAADNLKAAEQHAEEAKPDDWQLVEGFEIPLQDLPNGVALPWF